MTFEENFTEMRRLADHDGAQIYNICFRNAGVGIQWFEGKRAPGWNPETLGDYKPGLVIYGYHENLSAALDAELDRLTNLYMGWPEGTPR